MAGKTFDGRMLPSEKNCTVTISGEEGEVLELAAAHAVSTHGHIDDDSLHEGLRTAMRDEEELLLGEGAFLQLIEFHAGDPDRFMALTNEWRERIGRDATARWAVVGPIATVRTSTSRSSPSRTSTRRCGTPTTPPPPSSRRSCRTRRTARRASGTSTCAACCASVSVVFHVDHGQPARLSGW